MKWQYLWTDIFENMSVRILNWIAIDFIYLNIGLEIFPCNMVKQAIGGVPSSCHTPTITEAEISNVLQTIVVADFKAELWQEFLFRLAGATSTLLKTSLKSLQYCSHCTSQLLSIWQVLPPPDRLAELEGTSIPISGTELYNGCHHLC